MKNLLTALKGGFFVAGLMIAAMLVYQPIGAAETGTALPAGETDVSPSDSNGLRIPLSSSLSLDLSLSSIETSQSPDGGKKLYIPSVPMAKAPELGLERYRLGAGFSFRF